MASDHRVITQRRSWGVCTGERSGLGASVVHGVVSVAAALGTADGGHASETPLL